MALSDNRQRAQPPTSDNGQYSVTGGFWQAGEDRFPYSNANSDAQSHADSNSAAA